MMNIASIMSTVVPGTFVPDMRASEAPTVSAIPGVVTPPVDPAQTADGLTPQIESISGLSKMPGDLAGSVADLGPVPSVSGETSFKDTVKQLLAGVNDSINTSDQNTRDLASGKTNDVNKVVTSVEEANLALQYTMAIRTKLLETYSSVQTMQV